MSQSSVTNSMISPLLLARQLGSQPRAVGLATSLRPLWNATAIQKTEKMRRILPVTKLRLSEASRRAGKELAGVIESRVAIGGDRELGV
eukprot:scaffold2069_cov254-Pinguiococcus_pyrenoidosus.AAC.23